MTPVSHKQHTSISTAIFP